ncbi:MAG: hypothetical protein ACPG5U_06585 [Planktomarina sp.]
MDVYTYHHNATNGRSVAVVSAIFLTVALAYAYIDLHPMIAMVAVMLCMPATFEMGQNRKYSLTLDNREIRWSINKDTDAAQIENIEKVTLTTRLDFSTRITLHLKSGDKVRLHPGVTPKGDDLATQLNARNIPYTRQHFTFVS